MARYKNTRSTLSAINEGDEYTTLQDMLNCQSSFMKQEELWAVCRECCLALKRISDSAEIVQSLCVMLETLAFDSLGNVCFTDHEIEPDPHYLPPEFSEVGNSSKGHIYSLGMLIYEASAYNNSTTTKIPEHSSRLRKLLNRMMDSDYAERIHLEGVVKECDQYFLSAGLGSSLDICKHLVSSVTQRSREGSTEELTQLGNEEMEVVDSDLSPTFSKVASPGTTMSLQDLVEKYTPGRLKDDSKPTKERVRGVADISILSPPAEFGAKMNSVSSSSATGTSSSAFKHGSQADQRRREVGEGATLKAGNAPLRIPEAYRSTATHFTPIVVSNQDKKLSPRISSASGSPSKADRTIKELKKQLLKNHSIQEGNTKLSPSADVVKSPSSLLEYGSARAPPGGKHTPPGGKHTPNKPSIVQTKARGGVSIPVTQAVRPLPRHKDPQVSDSNLNESSTSVRLSENTLTSTSSSQLSLVDTPPSVTSATHALSDTHSTPVHAANPAHGIPSSAQPSLIANGATLPSPSMIPSYPSVPVMLQRDSATGAVSWLPVMPNMPYWTISPQQAAAVNAMHSIPPGAQSNTPPTTQLIPSNQTTPQQIPSNQHAPHQIQADQQYPQMAPANHQPLQQTSANQQPVQLTSANQQHSEPTPANQDANHRTPTNQQTAQQTPASRQSASNRQTASNQENINPHSRSTSGSVGSTKLSRQSARISSSREDLTAAKTSAVKDSSLTEAAAGVTQGNVTPSKARKEEKRLPSNKGTRSREPVKKKADHQKLLTLTKLRQLLKKEFAFEGYMNHGQEDVEMAEFIVSLHLPALDFTNWCNIIVAKYGDLYWSEELLVSLYEVVHGQKPDIDRPPSGALRAKSARVLSVDEPGSAAATQSVTQPSTQSVAQRFSTSPFRPIPLSETSLGVSSASSTPRKVKRSLLRPKAMLPQVHQSEVGSVDVAVAHSPLSLSLSRLKSASVTDLSRQQLQMSGLSKSKSQSLLQSHATETDMTPLVKSLILPNGGTRQVMYVEGKQANLLFDDIWTNSAGSATSAFEQESDSHSHSSASELRVKGRLHTYSMSTSMGDEFYDSAFGSKLSSEYESDNSLASHTQTTKSQNVICSTLIYATYMAENIDAVSVMGDKTARSVFISGYENKSVDGVKKKIADLSQQISVHCKKRNKACKYIKKIRDSSQSKGSVDYKAMLSQVQVDYRDAAKDLDYLCHAKLQLEVLVAEQSSIDVSCLFSFTKPSRPLLVIDTKENPRLNFHTIPDPRTNSEVEVLYAGEPYGLLSYLYANGALESGYVLDFFHSYRYLLAARDITAFITEKYNAAKELKPCEVRGKVMKRSLDLLTFWVTCYYSADLILSPTVVVTLINFLQDEVLSEHHAECEPLLKLLDEYENDKSKNSTFVNPIPVNEELPLIDDESNPLNKKWNSSRTVLTVGSGRSAVLYRRTGFGIVPSAVKLKKSGKETPLPSMSGPVDEFSIADHSPADLAEQLTLLDQALFRAVHPVNFMNTLAQGIGASLLTSSASDTIPKEEKKPLFHSDYIQLVAVPDMIQHAKKVAHWVTAEVINANGVKAQTAVVSKLMQVAKICKDLRNFATCMSIKDGLDHPLIRYIPAWRDIPAKLTQELDDVKLLLRTDSEALKAPDDLLGLPTIPCALLFSLHVQQLEQGGFTLSNGMYRWPKLKSLARLVDQVRLCKNYTYKFTDNPQLSELLINRMSEMYTHSLETLVITAGADNSGRGGATSAASRWSNVIKKVKGKFAQT